MGVILGDPRINEMLAGAMSVRIRYDKKKRGAGESEIKDDEARPLTMSSMILVND